MDKITQILENVVRCKYFEVGVCIKNPIKNSYQNGLGRMNQTVDHVVVVHILCMSFNLINKYFAIKIVLQRVNAQKFLFQTIQ